jgi:hypothetical protein
MTKHNLTPSDRLIQNARNKLQKGFTGYYNAAIRNKTPEAFKLERVKDAIMLLNMAMEEMEREMQQRDKRTA